MRRWLLATLVMTGGCHAWFLPKGDAPAAWTLSGDIRYIGQPDSLEYGSLESPDLLVFEEGPVQARERLPIEFITPDFEGELRIDGDSMNNGGDPGEDRVGDTLHAAYIHLDPLGSHADNRRATGTIDFGRPVLGIIAAPGTMELADAAIGHPTTVYPSDLGQDRTALWGDSYGDDVVVLGNGGTTLEINLGTFSASGFRVLLEAEDLDEEEPAERPYRYVLLEDLSDSDDDPRGADIDAIALEIGDRLHYATIVEETDISSPDCLPDQVLGEPDAECVLEGVCSMGADGHHLMVGFDSGGGEVRFGEGDAVVVYEVGEATCPDAGFRAQPVRVSVSPTPSPDDAVDVGTVDATRNRLVIP
jgi:hypothetical protein